MEEMVILTDGFVAVENGKVSYQVKQQSSLYPNNSSVDNSSR